MRTWREILTDSLDTLGLLALALAVGGGLWRWLGWFSLAASGVVILAGVRLYEHVAGGDDE